MGFHHGLAVLADSSDSTGDSPLELRVVEVPFLFEFFAFTNHWYEYSFPGDPALLSTYDGWELHVHMWPFVALFAVS